MTQPSHPIQQHRYEILLEATSPIAHHAEVLGNSAILMQRKLRMPDGSFQQIPIISADTMRHGMRSASAYALLEAAGLLAQGQLTEGALRLLFSGGMVTSKGDAGNINLERYRAMVELIPSMALFGGCTDSRVVPGYLQVDDAELVCTETAHRLSPEIKRYLKGERPEGTAPGPDQALASRRAHIEMATRVRMDPLLDPGKRKLLSAGAEAEAQKRLAEGELAHEQGDPVAKEATKSTMMPRSFEALVAGSLFRWGFSATTYSDLERDTLHCALAAFLAQAQVGGKKGTGHGRIRCAAIWGSVKTRELTDTRGLVSLEGQEVGRLFREHAKKHSAQIKTWLTEVQA